MRIGFDDQIFNAQRVGGISRYFAEFDADPELTVDPSLLLRYTTNVHLLELRRTGVRRPLIPPLLDRSLTMSIVNRLRPVRPHVDLIHHTYYPSTSPRAATPAICTVHDMIPELAPQHFPQGNPHRFKARTVSACAAVICVSETTRRDLRTCYGDIDVPVHVVHHGVSDRYVAAAGNPIRPEVPYALFVGTRTTYKNFRVLLLAFADFLTNFDGPADLLCVGGGAFTSDEHTLMHDLAIEDRVIQRAVPDSELPAVYAAATAFVFPSRYEGFGLPILEAMAAGCPTLVADTPAMIETGGDAAAAFDPDDDAALSSLLLTAFSDPEWHTARSSVGMARASGFSWAESAAATARVYRSVMSPK